jgi:hypothetical protein
MNKDKFRILTNDHIDQADPVPLHILISLLLRIVM